MRFRHACRVRAFPRGQRGGANHPVPTGLLDPKIELHPVEGQIDHLFGEIAKTVEHGGKVLVTTLTKRMAESLTDYLTQLGRARQDICTAT